MMKNVCNIFPCDKFLLDRRGRDGFHHGFDHWRDYGSRGGLGWDGPGRGGYPLFLMADYEAMLRPCPRLGNGFSNS
jgi:hypothetical protein